MGYHYEYAKVAIEDVVEVYKNEVKVDSKFVLTNDLLTPTVLKNLIKSYDEVVKQKGLDPIRPTKGKAVKALQAKRQELIGQLEASECYKSAKLSYLLTQCQRLQELTS